MCKERLSFPIPEPDVFQTYIDRTDSLLRELHDAMTKPWTDALSELSQSPEKFSPLHTGASLREPIFYSAESAYGFQYLDFAARKYANDNDWLEENHGFQIADTIRVANALETIQIKRVSDQRRLMRSTPPDHWSMLPIFEFTVNEVAEVSQLEIDTVNSVIVSFCYPETERNKDFTSLSDFNSTNSTPIIRKDAGTFILLQHASLLESVYETPAYWMGADRAYAPTAFKNRGNFTEEFISDRLERVFGRQNVFRNVDIYKGKNKRSEIDTMVTVGRHAIVVQAKSKRLTIDSRKGNDLQIKKDFRLAIQESYNQAVICGRLLLESGVSLSNKEGHKIHLRHEITQIHPMCIVSDHYPALAFQARQFLELESDPVIAAPIIADIFAIDAITEMLDNPLQFLHYLTLRSKFDRKLFATNELNLLAFHLRTNLFVEEAHDALMVGEDFTAHLDAAMFARRRGAPGSKIPNGILTRLAGTAIWKVVSQIGYDSDPIAIEIGLLLLYINETTSKAMSSGIDKIAALAQMDIKNHDISFSFAESNTGLTIHFNVDNISDAERRLGGHCSLRKYDCKVDSWFGLVLDPDDYHIRTALSVEGRWEADSAADALLSRLPLKRKMPIAQLTARPQKIGRNDPCSCGSGKKYKKCCLGH
jgi:SEC-C motif